MDAVTWTFIIGLIAMAAIGIGITIWARLKLGGTHHR